jgi:hypothetical protein
MIYAGLLAIAAIVAYRARRRHTEAHNESEPYLYRVLRGDE